MWRFQILTMSASVNLNEVARPLLTKDQWDIPPESVVRLKTIDGLSVMGTCYKNPAKTINNTDVIELVNCKISDSRAMSARTLSKKFGRFFSKDMTDCKY